MKAKKPIVAICYDFDGTLSPGYMQEYGFFLGLDKKRRKTFWEKSNGKAKELGADPILIYMQQMIEEAMQSGGKLGTTEKDFRAYGKNIEFFPGVEDWFARIKKYAADKGVQLHHYIISSGLKELVVGSRIGRHFRKIYACSFVHGLNNAAEWPAQVVNFTTKTQYLFRINKGNEDESESSGVNDYVEPEERPVPFTNILYFGDGETDVPCMKLVKEKGGHSFAVYSTGKKKSLDTSRKLFADGRVNYVVPADYSEGKQIDTLVKRIIDLVVARTELYNEGKKARPRNRIRKVTAECSSFVSKDKNIFKPMAICKSGELDQPASHADETNLPD
jgi:hypothetical protein